MEGHERRDSFRLFYEAYYKRLDLGHESRENIEIINDTLTLMEEITDFRYDSDYDTVSNTYKFTKVILNETKNVHLKIVFKPIDRDSIIQMVNQYKDTFVHFFEYDIMMGTVQNLKINLNHRHVSFSNFNPGDSTTIHIFSILNKYLPDSHKIYTLIFYRYIRKYLKEVD